MTSINLTEPINHTITAVVDMSPRKLYSNMVNDFTVRLDTLDALESEKPEAWRIVKYVLGAKQPKPVVGQKIFGQLRKNDKGVVLVWKEFVAK